MPLTRYSAGAPPSNGHADRVRRRRRRRHGPWRGRARSPQPSPVADPRGSLGGPPVGGEDHVEVHVVVDPLDLGCAHVHAAPRIHRVVALERVDAVLLALRRGAVADGVVPRPAEHHGIRGRMVHARTEHDRGDDGDEGDRRRDRAGAPSTSGDLACDDDPVRRGDPRHGGRHHRRPPATTLGGRGPQRHRGGDEDTSGRRHRAGEEHRLVGPPARFELHEPRHPTGPIDDSQYANITAVAAAARATGVAQASAAHVRIERSAPRARRGQAPARRTPPAAEAPARRARRR